MTPIRTFFHYSRFINEIKKDKVLLATSFARTYVYDWILENCPEELLSVKEIQRLKAYKKQCGKTIKLYKKEQANDENYESCYRDLKLHYRNPLLDEFFNNDGYVLAFSKKFEPGWLKGENEQNYVTAIFTKIGNQYAKFKIGDNMARRSYVLEQKYWTEKYHAPILKSRFGNGWRKLSKAFSREMFGGKKPTLHRYGEFKRQFIKLLFVNYYNSIVRLDDYEQNFEVPEFWIGADIPIRLCEFGIASFKELEEKTGVMRKAIMERRLTNADLSERKKKNSKSSLNRK